MKARHRRKRADVLDGLRLSDGRLALDVAARSGVPPELVMDRLDRGYGIDMAAELPVHKRRSSYDQWKVAAAYKLKYAAPRIEPIRLDPEEMLYFLDLENTAEGWVFLAQSEDLRLYADPSTDRYVLKRAINPAFSKLMPPNAEWVRVRLWSGFGRAAIHQALMDNEASEALLLFCDRLPVSACVAVDMLETGEIERLLAGVDRGKGGP